MNAQRLVFKTTHDPDESGNYSKSVGLCRGLDSRNGGDLSTTGLTLPPFIPPQAGGGKGERNELRYYKLLPIPRYQLRKSYFC